MEKQNNMSFGYQLLLDLYGCKPGVCDDLTLCYKFLDDAVIALGMEKQSPPNIFRSDEVRFPDKAGLSGWVPLIESSIVIHTLTPKDFISIDVYCCRSFDIRMAQKICQDFFHPRRIDTQFIERGMDYYKSDTDYHTVIVSKADTQSPAVTVSRKKDSLVLNR
jgi:S-adenosylmethionine decarboxylase